MSYKSGDSYVGEFTTQRFDTGAATDADSLPAATANHNGTDDGSFTLTVTNLDTGRYKITGTIPAYSSGDSVSISVAATVNSVAGKAVVDSFVLDAKRVGDLQDLSAAGIRTAVGLGSANLDTQLAEIEAETDGIAAIPTNPYTGTPPTVVAIANEVETRTIARVTLTDAVTNAPTAGDFTAAMKTSLNNATPTVSVGAVTLANNAITTAAIADGAITDAKFTVPAIAGVATGVLSMLVQVWRRFFRKVDKDSAGGTIKTYANDNASVLTTQTITSVGTTDTQGPAS